MATLELEMNPQKLARILHRALQDWHLSNGTVDTPARWDRLSPKGQQFWYNYAELIIGNLVLSTTQSSLDGATQSSLDLTRPFRSIVLAASLAGVMGATAPSPVLAASGTITHTHVGPHCFKFVLEANIPDPATGLLVPYNLKFGILYTDPNADHLITWIGQNEKNQVTVSETPPRPCGSDGDGNEGSSPPIPGIDGTWYPNDPRYGWSDPSGAQP